MPRLRRPARGIDYLVIGHVCRDLTPDGPRLGGTATFSALTAQALGLQAAIVTSAPSAMASLLCPLQTIPLYLHPSEQITTFENIYTPQGRAQTLRARAEPLTVTHVPSEWKKAPLVHLAPVADEVDPLLATAFPGALLGITPQGWMRQWDQVGHISYRSWNDGSIILSKVGAVVLSIEDINGDEGLVCTMARQAAILVVTRGADGCTVFVDATPHTIPAPQTDVLDPTGAGDIFAAAFFIRLWITHDPLAAARFATQLASASVARVGLEGIPSREAIVAALSGN